MNLLLQVCVGFLLAVGFIHFNFQAEAVVPDKPCAAIIQDLTKKQLGGITACTKKIKFKDNKDKAKKMTCILKCVLKKEMLLDEKGQIPPEQFGKFLDRHFPPSMFGKANATFLPCIEPPKEYDDADEFCKDYDPVLKCLLSNFPNMCAAP